MPTLICPNVLSINVVCLLLLLHIHVFRFISDYFCNWRKHYERLKHIFLCTFWNSFSCKNDAKLSNVNITRLYVIGDVIKIKLMSEWCHTSPCSDSTNKSLNFTIGYIGDQCYNILFFPIFLSISLYTHLDPHKRKTHLIITQCLHITIIYFKIVWFIQKDGRTRLFWDRCQWYSWGGLESRTESTGAAWDMS